MEILEIIDNLKAENIDQNWSEQKQAFAINLIADAFFYGMESQRNLTIQRMKDTNCSEEEIENLNYRYL